MQKIAMKQTDVLRFFQSKQKVKPSLNITNQLRVWEGVGYEVWEDEERTIPKAPNKAFLEQSCHGHRFLRILEM